MSDHLNVFSKRAPGRSVVYVITRGDSIGGAQTHVLEMASAMHIAGCRTTVVCGPGKALPDALRESGVSVIQIASLQRTLSPQHDLKCLFELRSILQSLKPDLVSLHSSKAGIIGRLACLGTRIPVLFTAHGWAFADGVGRMRARAYALLERTLQKACQRIICVSEADRELALQYGFDSDRLTVVHNGRHDRSVVPLRGRSSGSTHLVMVGRLDRQKDHGTLFRALEGLDKFHLELVGDGPLREELQDLAEKCGISSRVVFRGFLTDVTPVLASSDVFALISRWEGFPRSTLEAMCASLPVVVSDVGGSAEAVVEGSTGFVVPRGDVDAVRRALHALIEDETLRTAMGEAGRVHFLRNFTFDAMWNATIGIYADVSSIDDLPVLEHGGSRAPVLS